jgi:hypothetical protein
MTATVPPAPSIPPAIARDASHPAALAAPASITPATVAPPLLQDVSHPAAAPMAAVSPVGPVTASDPMPVPAPSAVSRTPLTVAPPLTAPENSPAAGIAPVTVAGAPVADPVAARVTPAAPVAALAPVITDADSRAVTLADTQIAGGVPVPPIVSLPEAQTPQPAARQAEAATSVRKLAARNSIDLATVTGTGAGGKVLGKDVKAAIAAKNAGAAGDADQPSPVTDGIADTTLAPVPSPAEAAPPPVTVLSSSPPTAAGIPDESTVTLRLNIAQRDDRTLSITSSDQLAAMAANALPGLMVISAALELSVQGPVLLAEVASTAAVEL